MPTWLQNGSDAETSITVLHWQPASCTDQRHEPLDLTAAQKIVDRAQSDVATHNDTKLVKRHEATELSIVSTSTLRRYRWFSTVRSIEIADVLDSCSGYSNDSIDDEDSEFTVNAEFHPATFPEFLPHVVKSDADARHTANDIEKVHGNPFAAFSTLLNDKDIGCPTDDDSSSDNLAPQAEQTLPQRRKRKRRPRGDQTTVSAHTRASTTDSAMPLHRNKVWRPALDFAPHAPTQLPHAAAQVQDVEALRVSRGLAAVARPAAHRAKARDSETSENLLARRPATKRLNAELDPPSGSQVVARFLKDQSKGKVPNRVVIERAKSRLADVSEVIEDFTASPIRIDVDTSAEWDDIIAASSKAPSRPTSSNLGRSSQPTASEGISDSVDPGRGGFSPGLPVQDTIILDVVDELRSDDRVAIPSVSRGKPPIVSLRKMLDLVFGHTCPPLQDIHAERLARANIPLSRLRFAAGMTTSLQQVLPPGRTGYWLLPLGAAESVPWDPGISSATVLGLRDIPHSELASLPKNRILWTLRRLQTLRDTVKEMQTQGKLGYVHMYPTTGIEDLTHLRLACTADAALHVRLLLDDLQCVVMRADAGSADRWFSSSIRLLWYDDVARQAVMSA